MATIPARDSTVLDASISIHGRLPSAPRLPARAIAAPAALEKVYEPRAGASNEAMPLPLLLQVETQAVARPIDHIGIVAKRADGWVLKKSSREILLASPFVKWAGFEDARVWVSGSMKDEALQVESIWRVRGREHDLVIEVEAAGEVTLHASVAHEGDCEVCDARACGECDHHRTLAVYPADEDGKLRLRLPAPVGEEVLYLDLNGLLVEFGWRIDGKKVRSPAKLRLPR